MLMGLQAGLPALDFGGIRGAKKREYIGAVHAALSRDYGSGASADNSPNSASEALRVTPVTDEKGLEIRHS
jgi:hypothetical protein